MNAFIKPIQLGKLKLASNLVQGPLAGYSCAAFRTLIWEYSHPGFCTTEMISAHDLVHRKNKPQRYLYKDPTEKILSYQLSGNNPEHLAKATEIVNKAGADIIDLNCGCPVNKIRRKNCGSKLLTNPEQLFTLVSAIKQNTNAAVSIKIRVSTPINDHDDKEVVDAAIRAGVDFITVHGRHWTQRYDVPSQIEAIAHIVKLSTVPVFANGDVENHESLNQLFEKTHCAGVMIARASVGRPWLFSQLTSSTATPSLPEIGHIFITHIERIKQLENDKLAVLQARKLAKYYGQHIMQCTEFVNEIQQAESLLQVIAIVRQYFASYRSK